MSQIVLAHALRQVSVSLILGVRQKTNKMREAHNFSDDLAFATGWHGPGMRYIEVALTHTCSLKDIAAGLTCDHRFAVDFIALKPNGAEMRAHGYIFRNIKEDDHQFRLGSLDPVELSYVIATLSADLGIANFQATECFSTDTRGRPDRRQKFQKTK